MMKLDKLSRQCCLLLIVGLLNACAAGPNPSLERAQAAYNDARQQAGLAENAPVALGEAEATLRRAERIWSQEGDAAEVEHLTYLVDKQLATAQAISRRKIAEAKIDRLSGAKDKVLLTAAQEKAARLERELAELKARETSRGLELTLGDVLFEVGKAELKPGTLRKLSPLVDFLRANPNRSLLIEGHTDSTGSSAFNLQLSEQRAETVWSYLARQGIQPQRMIARGYGEAYPVAANSNAAGRQQNRRVEIVILNAGENPLDRARPAITG